MTFLQAGPTITFDQRWDAQLLALCWWIPADRIAGPTSFGDEAIFRLSLPVWDRPRPGPSRSARSRAEPERDPGAARLSLAGGAEEVADRIIAGRGDHLGRPAPGTPFAGRERDRCYHRRRYPAGGDNESARRFASRARDGGGADRWSHLGDLDPRLQHFHRQQIAGLDGWPHRLGDGCLRCPVGDYKDIGNPGDIETKRTVRSGA